MPAPNRLRDEVAYAWTGREFDSLATRVPIRQAFFRQRSRGPTGDRLPPLARMVRIPGGPHGDDTRAHSRATGRAEMSAAGVCVALYLSLVVRAGSRPGGSAVDASTFRDWADRLGLFGEGTKPPPSGRASAARRVRNAMSWLVQHGLVEQVSKADCPEGAVADGRASPVRLLAEDASGSPYRRWTDGETEQRRRLHEENDRAFLSDNEWEGPPIEVPLAFWAEGWVTGLSPKAVAALFVLMDQSVGVEPKSLPRIRKRQYGLSSQVWNAGCRELKERRLVTISALPKAGIASRYEYQLHIERLVRT